MSICPGQKKERYLVIKQMLEIFLILKLDLIVIKLYKLVSILTKVQGRMKIKLLPKAIHFFV